MGDADRQTPEAHYQSSLIDELQEWMEFLTLTPKVVLWPTRLHTETHTDTDTRTHTDIYTDTHRDTQTYTQTHTDTHMHTH